MPVPDPIVAGSRAFLLAHVDPMFAEEVMNRAARNPKLAAHPNAVIFGENVPHPLQALLRSIVSAALDASFLSDLCDVIEHARTPGYISGLRVIRQLPSTFVVTMPPPPHDVVTCGAVTAPDAVCDLLVQPLMAFVNLFVGLSTQWVQLADDPELAKKVFYRTNMATHVEARLENRIRLTLGLTTTLHEGGILNVP
jgi:hypothetical protein